METGLKKQFLTSLAGVAGIFLLVSAAIYYRVIFFSGISEVSFLEVLAWQAVSWSPWILIIALLILPYGKKVQDFILSWNPAAHIVAAVSVAAASTLWFKTISENFSPFLGLENTRYGVFPWFFIFWFFFGLLLYWGVVSYSGLAGGRPERGEGKRSQARLVVKTGKVSEVVKPDNVMWIEAQDYYSVLHLSEKQSWIKMTMKELEESLDPATFIRVHRSTIINVNHLKQIQKDSPGKYIAVMNDGKKRPISRAGWRDLKKVLKTGK